MTRSCFLCPLVERFSRCALAVCLLFAGACAAGSPTAARESAAAAAPAFQEGQIIDAATGLVVPLDQLVAALLRQDVVYLGEEHRNHFHVESALLLFRELSARGREPVLGMEMFDWEAQPVIDRYVSDAGLSREEFLGQVRWQQIWGGPFEDYEPLVRFAIEHRLRLVGLNPPKSLVRSVAKVGLEEARRGPEMAEWHMQDEAIVDDPAYRSRILQQLRACHNGGSDAMYQTMYEASMVRDEGMAKTIVSEIARLRAGGRTSSGPFISYTGGGHIQFNLPVPNRVARRSGDRVRQTSIYMTAFENERIEEIAGMIKEKIADYIWLTPVGAQGPPRRCR